MLSVAPAPTGEFRMNYFRLLNADKLGLAYSFRYATNLAGAPPVWTSFTPELISATPVGTTHELNLIRVPGNLVATNQHLFIQLQVE
jgi:hypothetical protein